jgi:phenylpropionate dioxygenase-like ring-hydroxylating dioxygenase large terminal subunit
MLSKEENELLTRVGPGTAMGTLLRHYWIPALLSEELSGPDCTPVRVRLLGEDLVAFRDTNGTVGLIAANCPHRGASLFFGRNEECGIRCVYHGWKFDVTGQCVDMPSEPAESNFKSKIKASAYPCREAGGIVWTYMGTLAQPPELSELSELPELEFTLLPEAQVMVQNRLQYCNWVQALEGDIDQSHVGFLHSRVSSHEALTPEEAASYGSLEQYYKRVDRSPRYSLVDTDYGVMGCATRGVGGDAAYYRVSHFLMPFWTITPPGDESDPARSIRGWVPMDDETVMVFGISYHPTRPFEPRAYERLKTGSGANWVGTDHLLPASSAPGGRWRPQASRANDYFLDRELQRQGPYSGIQEFWAQDAAMQESMGAIYDRSREHLGTSDAFVIRMRDRLLRAAQSLQDQGIIPVGADTPDAYRVRGVQVVSSSAVPWPEATAPLCRIVPGVNPGGAELGLLREGATPSRYS